MPKNKTTTTNAHATTEASDDEPSSGARSLKSSWVDSRTFFIAREPMLFTKSSSALTRVGRCHERLQRHMREA
jgi:hypothetical protein